MRVGRIFFASFCQFGEVLFNFSVISMSTFFSRLCSCLLVVCIGMVVGVSSLSAQVFYPGEYLEYKVSYLGISLGSVKIITEGFDTYEGKQVVKTTAYIDSRPGIPFVDLHTVYRSTMDRTAGYAYLFNASTKTDGDWKYDKYTFDYAASRVVLETGFKDKAEKTVEIKTDRKWNDGLSLFFFARMFLDSKRYVSVPTIIEFDTVKTTINFTGKKENVSIDVLDYDVKTVYFKGDANWTGVYGLTGKFEGWFTDDDAHIPISAKMKVYVGNVDIELVKWKRGDWTPPQAK